MTFNELYTIIKDVSGVANPSGSFYFIEPHNRNDVGDPAEYPKVVLLKPIASNSVKNGSSRTSQFEVVIEVLDIYDETSTNLLDSQEAELAVINGCELIARDIIKLIKSTVTINKLTLDNFRLQTIHEDFIDNVSGVELSMTITAPDPLC